MATKRSWDAGRAPSILRHGGVVRGAVFPWCCSGLASRRLGVSALQIVFSSKRVSTMTLDQQCRHEGSLAASHLQQRPSRVLHRLALRIFLLRQLWPALPPVLQSQLPLLRSHPRAAKNLAIL